MKFISLASLLFLPIILSQDVKFGDSGSAPESQTKIEVGDNGSGNGEITEEDVNERFLNLDLGDFGNNVAASALGTVIGNVGTNLAGNFLNGCSNRGRRSVLMHKIEKRQAIEASQKTGNSEEDPEVAERFLPCPQQFLNPGGNNGRYCDRCYCSDWDCRRDCRKCSYNNGPNNWSSNSGNNNNWSSSSSNGWSSGSTSSSLNCRTCNCKYSSCKRGCSKCYSSSNNHNSYPSNNNHNSYPSSGSNNYYPSNNNINCDTCNCSYSSCRNDCARCHVNTSGNNFGWSSSNSGGNYNNGWRNGVNGRTGSESDDSEVIVEQTSSEKESSDGAVVFA